VALCEGPVVAEYVFGSAEGPFLGEIIRRHHGFRPFDSIYRPVSLAHRRDPSGCLGQRA
jgi:hypothetical protein